MLPIIKYILLLLIAQTELSHGANQSTIFTTTTTTTTQAQSSPAIGGAIDDLDDEKPAPVYYAWYGVMVLRLTNNNGSVMAQEKRCTSFYPEISDMAETEDTAEFHPVMDLFDWSPCSSPPPVEGLADHLLLLDGYDNNTDVNCSLIDAAAMAQSYGALGSIFVRGTMPPGQNISNTSLWITFISNTTYQYMTSEDLALLSVAVYSPPEEQPFNYALVVIWLLATGTVTVGAYWSGVVRYRLYQDSLQMALCEQAVEGSPGPHHTLPCEGEEEEDGQARKTHAYPREETALDISPRVALLFVMLMCVMLVSLYFLYQYLVYMIIGLFCIASVGAVYACLEPLVMRIPCGTCRTPYFNLILVRGQLEVRHVLLLVFSLSLTITWVVLRNHQYAWILQDILGIFFCINMLRMIRLPNLKICTVLLSCLFFYDIFFVFITPLFTSDGSSIMVEVAQGSKGGGEQLPMVYKVPHFTYSEVVQVCQLPGNYNLLGFGDVLVPGLLIAYLRYYDFKVSRGGFPLYFAINIIAYGVGLMVTFVALYLMRGAQPALLYLVPCTLVPTVVLGAVRGHLSDMWRGEVSLRPADVSDTGTDDVVPQVVTLPPPRPTQHQQQQVDDDDVAPLSSQSLPSSSPPSSASPHLTPSPPSPIAYQ